MALAFEEREYSLPQLDALANGMAAALEQRGVRPGDRIALMSSNRPEFVVALRAIWRLGAAAVLLSPAWKRSRGRARAGADRAVACRRRPSGARRADADAVARRGRHTRAAGVRSAGAGQRMRCSCSARARRACPRRSATPTARSRSPCAHWRDALGLSSADRMQIVTPPSHILGLLNIVTALDDRRLDSAASPLRPRP